MPVEEAYRYIRSGVLKHYPSVLHSEDAIEGPLAFCREARSGVERTLTTVSYYAFEG